MEDSTNRNYRIRTNVGVDEVVRVDVPLVQTYDTFEILSLKLNQKNQYNFYDAPYGVIVGRVLANDNFGIPNAKVSIFIPVENEASLSERILYNFASTQDTNFDGVRYNLLPDFVDAACHQDVGTFPNKRLVLDNKDVIEIFDKYYTYTTTTNQSGDYMIFGVPTGSQTLHVDIDLSDIGMLSQRPRDMAYKGYNIEQFDSPNKFKSSTNLNSLSQIITQDKGIYCYPYWGNSNNDTSSGPSQIAITRADIKIDYKFEPTAIFIGSIITDKGSNTIGKNCTGTETLGKMSDLAAGEGKIEMIRKTIDNKIEQFQIKGDRLIDGDGVWCYQIPMNLDYMKTDEFGNMVPTDDPSKGIATRSRVRFRISLDEMSDDVDSNKRCRFLVPNNPRYDKDEFPEFYRTKEADYEFGSATREESYCDLFWNNVYTVKSYIPRLQKNRKVTNRNHTGIKLINHYGDNNPMPYNNLNIKLSFTYRFICVLIKIMIFIIALINTILGVITNTFCLLSEIFFTIAKILNYINIFGIRPLGPVAEIFKAIGKLFDAMAIPGITIGSELCDDGINKIAFYFILVPKATLDCILSKIQKDHGRKYRGVTDVNEVEEFKIVTLTSLNNNEFVTCVEQQLAQANDAVSYLFQNDWVNGVLYAPLWYRYIRKKKSYFFGLFKSRARDQWCRENGVYNLIKFQPCALSQNMGGDIFKNPYDNSYQTTPANIGTRCGSKCHENIQYQTINGGLIVTRQTMLDQTVYYYKAIENNYKLALSHKAKNNSGDSNDNDGDGDGVVLLFATDIVLLGSLNDCDTNGIPQLFKRLRSTSCNFPLAEILFVDTTIALNNDGTVVVLEDGTIPMSKETEATGADWGNLNSADECGKMGDATDSGLFYGIGCSAVEMEAKSCINLNRMCELGVSVDVSQEIADVTNGGLKYVTLTPDGYISYDDIYDPDGRSMFATLNGNKLRTRLDEKTGYRKYDFLYLYVDNFDGLSKQFMRKSGNDCNYTQNYKLEKMCKSYYMFRMGQKPYYYDRSHSLPRYENSFYFYFGLKTGKTAIDKFNKQFFSDCEDTNQLMIPIGIETKPNSWCPADAKDGYLKLDLSHVSTPYDLVINSSNNSGVSYVIKDINYEKVYICGDPEKHIKNGVFNGYERLELENEYFEDSQGGYKKNDKGEYEKLLPKEIYNGKTYRQLYKYVNSSDDIVLGENEYFEVNEDDERNLYVKDDDGNFILYNDEETPDGEENTDDKETPDEEQTLTSETLDGEETSNDEEASDEENENNETTFFKIISYKLIGSNLSDEEYYGVSEGIYCKNDEGIFVELPEQYYVGTRYTILPSYITNSEYKISITDSDGEIITTTFTLGGEKLQFGYTTVDNELPNDQRVIKYNSVNSLITAVSGHIGNAEQDLGGYIIINNFNNGENTKDITVKVSVRPFTPSDLEGFLDCNSNFGYECTVVVDENNEGDIRFNSLKSNNNIFLLRNELLYIIVPKGGIDYAVTITQMCEDDDGKFIDSDNSTTLVIRVNDTIPYKLFINDIDVSAFKKDEFELGWNISENNGIYKADITNINKLTKNSNGTKKETGWLYLSNKDNYDFTVLDEYQDAKKNIDYAIEALNIDIYNNEVYLEDTLSQFISLCDDNYDDENDVPREDLKKVLEDSLRNTLKVNITNILDETKEIVEMLDEYSKSRSDLKNAIDETTTKIKELLQTSDDEQTSGGEEPSDEEKKPDDKETLDNEQALTAETLDGEEVSDEEETTDDEDENTVDYKCEEAKVGATIITTFQEQLDLIKGLLEKINDDDFLEIQEVKNNFINEVKMAFWLTCDMSPKDIVYSVRTKKKPIEYYALYDEEVGTIFSGNSLHGNTQYPEINDTLYYIDSIRIPTVTIKNDENYGYQGNKVTEAITTADGIDICFGYDNSNGRTLNNRDKEKKWFKKPYAISVTNSMKDSLPPSTYATFVDIGKDSKKRNFFAFHIIDKRMLLDMIAWAYINKIPYPMVDNDLQTTAQYRLTEMYGKYIELNGLICGDIMNGIPPFSEMTYEGTEFFYKNYMGTTEDSLPTLRRICANHPLKKIIEYVPQSTELLEYEYYRYDDVSYRRKETWTKYEEGAELSDNDTLYIRDKDGNFKEYVGQELWKENGEELYVKSVTYEKSDPGDKLDDGEELYIKIYHYAKNYGSPLTDNEEDTSGTYQGYGKPTNVTLSNDKQPYIEVYNRPGDLTISSESCTITETIYGNMTIGLSNNYQSGDWMYFDLLLKNGDDDDDDTFYIFKDDKDKKTPYPLRYVCFTDNNNRLIAGSKINDTIMSYDTRNFTDKYWEAFEGSITDESDDSTTTTKGYGKNKTFKVKSKDVKDNRFYIVSETSNGCRTLSPLYVLSEVTVSFELATIQEIIVNQFEAYDNHYLIVKITNPKLPYYLDNYDYNVYFNLQTRNGLKLDEEFICKAGTISNIFHIGNNLYNSLKDYADLIPYYGAEDILLSWIKQFDIIDCTNLRLFVTKRFLRGTNNYIAVQWQIDGVSIDENGNAVESELVLDTQIPKLSIVPTNKIINSGLVDYYTYNQALVMKTITPLKPGEQHSTDHDHAWLATDQSGTEFNIWGGWHIVKPLIIKPVFDEIKVTFEVNPAGTSAWSRIVTTNKDYVAELTNGYDDMTLNFNNALSLFNFWYFKGHQENNQCIVGNKVCTPKNTTVRGAWTVLSFNGFSDHTGNEMDTAGNYTLIITSYRDVQNGTIESIGIEVVEVDNCSVNGEIRRDANFVARHYVPITVTKDNIDNGTITINIKQEDTEGVKTIKDTLTLEFNVQHDVHPGPGPIEPPIERI